MANTISQLSLSTLLKYIQHGGVINLLPDHGELWKMVQKIRVADDKGLSYQYEVQISDGMGGVQAGSYAPTATLPAGDRVEVSKATAEYKLTEMTLEWDLDIERRSGSEQFAFGKQIAMEADAKKRTAAKVKSAEALGDGTGILGVISSVSVSSGAGVFVLTKSSATAGRSHIGWFNEGDKYIVGAGDSTTIQVGYDNNASGVAYWRCTQVDYANDTVYMKPYDSSDALITLTSFTHALSPAAADVIYRYGDGTSASAVDPSATPTDWGTASRHMVGLEKLTSNTATDVVHGLTMTSLLQGSREAASSAVGRAELQALLSRLNRRLGNGEFNRMKYNSALMADSVYDALALAGDADKQFYNTNDIVGGVSRVGFMYQRKMIDFIPDQHVPKCRIYVIPEGKEVLQYVGTDFKDIVIGGRKEFDKVNSSGQRMKQAQRHMQCGGVLIAPKACAIGVITGDSLA